MDAAYLNDLKDGYFAQDGFVKESFMCSHSIAIANEFLNSGISNKQIRSFFNKVNQYDILTRQNVMHFREARANLLWLLSVAVDKQQKDHVPGCFKTFLEKNIDAIHTEKDLTIFKEHFETICNYMPEKKEGNQAPQNRPQGNSQNGYNKTGNGYGGTRQGNNGNNFWKNR